jgi:hypothetical protein
MPVPVDDEAAASKDRRMHDDPPSADGDESPDPLDPLEPFDAREAARVRRRDHDLDAQHRDLMRPGMSKVFKQITDSWSPKAHRAGRHAQKTTRDDD